MGVQEFAKRKKENESWVESNGEGSREIETTLGRRKCRNRGGDPGENANEAKLRKFSSLHKWFSHSAFTWK